MYYIMYYVWEKTSDLLITLCTHAQQGQAIGHSVYLYV